MLVTTTYEPSPDLLFQSKQLAERIKGRWVLRQKRSLSKLRLLYEEQSILVVSELNLKYYHSGDNAAFFHPSSAMVRIKRMLSGESDLMIKVSGAECGDQILDCTAGLASDAIVFAHKIGSSGKLTALESDAVLCLLLKEGLAKYHTEVPGLIAAMQRVDVVHTDHLVYLRSLDDLSYDIVYFDPMFRHPIEVSNSLHPIREIANHEPISLEAIAEARRVARKSVVLKELRDSREFEHLGFTQVFKSNTKIAYGVIQ